MSNQGTEEVRNRISQATLGTASQGMSDFERMYCEEGYLAAVRTEAAVLGPTVATALSVAMGGMSEGAIGKWMKATTRFVSVHGGEAGLSAAERVGKFFGVYPNAANPARQAVLIERYMGQGFSREAAEALARPYSGMGEHLIPRRWLRGVGLPETALDITVLKPRGISYGEFYELHYGVDSRFFGTALPRGLGPWEGTVIVGEKYGALGKAWYGTSVGVKAAGGAAAGAAGYGVYRATQSPPDSAGSE